jgi:hypothetical protein
LLYVLPPCGRCREFIREVDPANLDTEVILGSDQSALLRELLPANEWPEPLASDCGAPMSDRHLRLIAGSPTSKRRWDSAACSWACGHDMPTAVLPV